MEIHPRTVGERRALLTGYAMAINDVDEHGVDFARTVLRDLVVTEDWLASASSD